MGRSLDRLVDLRFQMQELSDRGVQRKKDINPLLAPIAYSHDEVIEIFYKPHRKYKTKITLEDVSDGKL